MMTIIRRWIFRCQSETDELVGQREKIVDEAKTASRKATRQAFDLIAETQRAGHRATAEKHAISDLLSQMDARRHARTPRR